MPGIGIVTTHSVPPYVCSIVVSSSLPAFTALIRLLNECYALLTQQTSDEAEAGMTTVDVEEQMVSYQCPSSRLSASGIQGPGPVAYESSI